MGSSKAMREVVDVERDLVDMEPQPASTPDLELEAEPEEDFELEPEPEPEVQPIAVDHMWLEPEQVSDAVPVTFSEDVLPPPPLAEPPVVESEGSPAVDSMAAPQVGGGGVTEENEGLGQ
jgi:hypothetical protein